MDSDSKAYAATEEELEQGRLRGQLQQMADEVGLLIVKGHLMKPYEKHGIAVTLPDGGALTVTIRRDGPVSGR